jgi:O-antigen/teichoic acid export membrane protein
MAIGASEQAAAAGTDGAEPLAVPDSKPQSGKLGRRLFSNYIFQLLNQMIRICEQILLVPLFLSAWGPDLYKDWILIYAIVAFLTSCNFGTEYYFGNLFLRDVAMRDGRMLDRNLRVGLFCALAISTALLVISFGTMLAFDVTHLLTFASMDRATVYASLAAMIFPVAVLISEQVLHTLYRAHGDFARGECIYAIYLASQIACVVVSLALAQPPWVVALSYLAVPLLFTGGLLLDLKRRYPHIRFGLQMPASLAEVREIVQQSSLFFTYPLSLAIVQNAMIVVLGLLKVAATGVVTYTVFRTFTGLTRQAANQFAVGGAIEMARQHVSGEVDACRRLYFDTGRIVALLVGVLGGFSVIAYAPFIDLWTHGAVGPDPWLLAAFLGSIFLAAPGQASLMLLKYGNHPRPCAIAWIVQSVGGLALAACLVPGMGVVGAALGLGIAEVLAIGLWLPFVAERVYGFNAVRHLLSGYGTGVVAFAISTGIAALAFSLHLPGLFGIFAAAALWAVVVAPPTAALILPKAKRAALLARLRQRLQPAPSTAARAPAVSITGADGNVR